MIEYWETLGRLAAYPELLRKFENLEAIKKERNEVTVLSSKDGPVRTTGLDINEDDYAEVQDFLAPVLTEQALSLFATGELIWDFSYQTTRDAMWKLNHLMAELEPTLYGPSTAFYIAVGKMVADPAIRDQVKDTPEESVNLFPRLSLSERAKIDALAASDEFPVICDQFGLKTWPKGCSALALPAEGYFQPSATWVKPTKQGHLVLATREDYNQKKTTAAAAHR